VISLWVKRFEYEVKKVDSESDRKVRFGVERRMICCLKLAYLLLPNHDMD
jgi:hypothetical protein